METDTRYIFGDVEFHPLFGGMLVRACNKETKKRIILPPHEAGLLFFCTEFRSTRNHAERYWAKFPQYNLKKLLRKVEFFVSKGFLISEEDYFSNILKKVNISGRHQDNTHTIEAIGIPTANRPLELDRALETFIANVLENNRIVEFVIADDSDSANLELNKSIVKKHQEKYPGKITHLDSEARKNLVTKMSERRPDLKELIYFSILGNDETSVRIGALRNAIMLYCAGKMVLFVDDDVICSIHENTTGSFTKNKIDQLIFSGIHPKQTSFFADYSKVINHYKKIKTDYLAIHELLLGKTIPDVLLKSGKYLFDDEPKSVTSSLMSKLNSENIHTSKVVVSYTGALGDSWMRVHPQTMIIPEDPENILWGKDIGEYTHNRLHGGISRSAKYPTIYSGPNCISLNLGADLREMLPPFAPLYRSQDAIFGYLLHYCFNDSFSSFLPPMIEHRRNEKRGPKIDPLYNFTTIGKVVITVISFLKNIDSESTDNSISIIGQKLIEFSKIKTETAKGIILEETTLRLKGFASYAKNLLDENKDAPEYWKTDMVQMINSIDVMNESPELIPFFWDVSEWNNKEELAWVTFMSWLEKLGTVLVYWPEIFEEALHMNSEKPIVSS